MLKQHSLMRLEKHSAVLCAYCLVEFDVRKELSQHLAETHWIEWKLSFAVESLPDSPSTPAKETSMDQPSSFFSTEQGEEMESEMEMNNDDDSAAMDCEEGNVGQTITTSDAAVAPTFQNASDIANFPLDSTELDFQQCSVKQSTSYIMKSPVVLKSITAEPPTTLDISTKNQISLRSIYLLCCPICLKARLEFDLYQQWKMSCP